MPEYTFAFADLAGFTALTEAHGDIGAASIATKFYELAAEAIIDDARLVKTIGDAVMLVAAKPEHGIRCVLRLAAAVAAEPDFPSVRIGLHTGPAAEVANDYLGAAVNLAARVAGHARAGEVLCTEPVAAVCVELKLATVQPLGAVRLKNIVAPVTLFELSTGTETKELLYVDPVCRMRVAADGAPATLVYQRSRFYFCSLECAKRFAETPEAYFSGASP